LFVVAYKSFPRSFLVKSIGATFTISLYIYNYLREYGVDKLVSRVLLTAFIVGAVPTISLYLITLARAPRIRRREEKETARQRHIAHGDLEALQAREAKAEEEIVRLEQVATGDRKARRVKDEQDDERWVLLNESLRLQNKTVELASEERLLVAQQVKESKEEGEVIRKGLASDDLEARHVKDLKEDKRWALLNESIRQQKETVDLASEERLLVAQQVKEKKEEGEIMRKGLVSDDLEARRLREQREEKRWEALYERLRVQEERSDERERRQLLRDEEQARLLLALQKEIAGIIAPQTTL
jgi:hypothetical protein